MFRFCCHKIAIGTIIIVSFSFSSTTGGDFGRVFLNGECLRPDGGRGICRNINECDSLLGLLKNGKSRPQPWVIDFLRRSHCGFEGKDPVVCCPLAVKPKGNRASLNLHFTAFFKRLKWYNLEKGNVKETRKSAAHGERGLPTIKNPLLEKFLNKSCGSVQTLDKVIGGTVTELHEFPWMALIGYKTSSGMQFRCGGSLISSHYVLTAAHCVTTLKDIYPTSVRLGEHDLDTPIDCSDGKGCTPPAKDIAIEEIIPHPDYFKPELRNDIALIRLAKSVEFKDSIRPICLPIQTDMTMRSMPSTKAVVAGWGTTELGVLSPVLKKVTLPIIPLSECSKIYKRKVPITDSQICAGGEPGKDSCSGDSGGPLQVIGLNPSGEPAYIQHGIVSFGSRLCGVRGMPGVYTKVASYVDWILNNVKE